jgi:hypothetical protein
LASFDNHQVDFKKQTEKNTEMEDSRSQYMILYYIAYHISYEGWTQDGGRHGSAYGQRSKDSESNKSGKTRKERIEEDDPVISE